MRLPKTTGTARALFGRKLRYRKGLICSFPTRSDGAKIQIVQDVPLNDFARAKIEASVNELKEESSMVEELLAG